MKIVAINGSPNGQQGATGRLLAALVEGARSEGAEVRIFVLAKLAVKPCTSCRACQQTGTCPIEDDYHEIKAAMIAADGIVFGSPNYISSVSAQLKAVLDRSFSMIHCQALYDKYGAAVVASGGPAYQQPMEYLTQIVGRCGCWKVGGVGTGGGVIDDPEEAPAVLAEARELGAALARAIKEKQHFADQAEELEQGFEMMRWLVEQRKEHWPYEYQYWQTHWPQN